MFTINYVNIHTFLFNDIRLVEVCTATVLCGFPNPRFLFLFYSTLYHLFQLVTLVKQWLVLCVFGDGRYHKNRHNTLAMGRQRMKNKESYEGSYEYLYRKVFEKRKNIITIH